MSWSGEEKGGGSVFVFAGEEDGEEKRGDNVDAEAVTDVNVDGIGIVDGIGDVDGTGEVAREGAFQVAWYGGRRGEGEKKEDPNATK